MNPAPIRLHLPKSMDCREKDVRDVASYIAERLERSEAIAAARPLAGANPDLLGFRAVVAAAPEGDRQDSTLHAVLLYCRGDICLLEDEDVAAWLAEQAPGSYADPASFSVIVEHAFERDLRQFGALYCIERLTEARADWRRRHPWSDLLG